MDCPNRGNKPPAGNAGSLFLKADPGAFKEMFDSASDAMLVRHGRDDVYCYVNRSACGMTGYTFSELTNMGLKDLVHPDDLGKVKDLWEKGQKGMDSPCRYETRIVTKKGDVIPVQVTVTECRRGGKSLFLAIVRDIREEKHLEHEMKKSLGNLKEEMLKDRSEWETLKMDLYQAQQAVSVLAKNIDNEKAELEQRVNTTIFSKVIPIIDDLLAEKRVKKFWPEIRSMAEYLKSITTKSKLHLEAVSVLTDTEMKIAAMLKNKMITNEIASVMGLSPQTVQTHRKNIRKKLKIQNSKHRLSEYLATVMEE